MSESVAPQSRKATGVKYFDELTKSSTFGFRNYSSIQLGESPNMQSVYAKRSVSGLRQERESSLPSKIPKEKVVLRSPLITKYQKHKKLLQS